MFLTSMTLKGFRCFELLELDDVDRLAVVVGENDAGKTVVLDAIEVLVGTVTCGVPDFRNDPDGVVTSAVEVSGVFKLEAHDTLPIDWRVGAGKEELRLRRRFTATTAETYVWELGFDDPAYDDFKGKNAGEQKELLTRAGDTPAGNESGRLEQFKALVDAGTIGRSTERERKLSSANELKPHLPRVERISSAEYRSPDAMIQRTLQTVAAGVLYPLDPETQQPTEHATLAQIRGEVTKRLNEEIEKARDVLQRIHPSLKGITVAPSIDFTKAVTTTPLTVNIGEGDRLLSSFGEGTKKRLWMGLMDWEQRAAKASVAGSVLRLYDEPDVNLAYQAQRHLFSKICEIAQDTSLRTQCFVCTHAVTFVDRAPCEAICLIEVRPDGARRLHRIRGGGSADVLKFFNEVGRAVGLTNTVLLYERAFLMVEGPSEVASLPILYRMLHGRSLEEDGLVVINLHTCSAWKSVVEVMLSNRLALTHLLLDADCKDPASSARITSNTLTELNCPPNFLADHVTFVGTKEYEDCFDDPVIAGALDAEYPRQDGQPWLPEISALRAKQTPSSRFSEELQFMVRKACELRLRSEATKPNLAAAVARQCRVPDDVPATLRDAIDRLRLRAGITSVPAAPTASAPPLPTANHLPLASPN